MKLGCLYELKYVAPTWSRAFWVDDFFGSGGRGAAETAKAKARVEMIKESCMLFRGKQRNKEKDWIDCELLRKKGKGWLADGDLLCFFLYAATPQLSLGARFQPALQFAALKVALGAYRYTKNGWKLCRWGPVADLAHAETFDGIFIAPPYVCKSGVCGVIRTCGQLHANIIFYSFRIELRLSYFLTRAHP